MNFVEEINPLITIITVVRNSGEALERTIMSVAACNCSDIEYIIIDGCSKDTTLEILQKYDSKITLWISEEDNGIYDAMNKGWQLAKNSYILFLGAGDEIIELPNNIQDLDKNVIYYGQVKIGDKFYRSEMSSKIKLGNTLHHQALLIHKSVCKNTPFNATYKIYADYDLNLRLYKNGYQFISINRFSSFAEPGGLSSTVYIKELLNIVRKNLGFFWMLTAVLYHLIQGFKYGFRQYTFK